MYRGGATGRGRRRGDCVTSCTLLQPNCDAVCMTFGRGPPSPRSFDIYPSGRPFAQSARRTSCPDIYAALQTNTKRIRSLGSRVCLTPDGPTVTVRRVLGYLHIPKQIRGVQGVKDYRPRETRSSHEQGCLLPGKGPAAVLRCRFTAACAAGESHFRLACGCCVGAQRGNQEKSDSPSFTVLEVK